MKVLHILKTAEGAVWAWRQIRELVAAGVSVEVVLPALGKMNQKYEEIGVPVHILNCDLANNFSPIKFYQNLCRLRNLVRIVSPDIIHNHFVGTTLFTRIVLGRHAALPRIFQVPGPLHLENFLTRKVEILSAGKSDYWIASCKFTKQTYLANGIDEERVGLSFYGTDVDQFTFGMQGKLRQELNISKDAILVGMVAFVYPPKKWLGQVRGIKGHEDFIDAIKLLIDQGFDIFAVVAGGAWNNAEEYFEDVKNYGISRLRDRIIFLGNRTDIANIYADLSIAVHPSHSENLGGAVESMLSKVPTIASNVGGFPDIVIDGETGWLSEAKKPQSISSAIKSILSAPKEADLRAQRAYKLVKRELDVKRTAQQVLVIYKSILN